MSKIGTSNVKDAVRAPLWIDELAPVIEPRPPLSGDQQIDVAIVGGGFSGLWTAYYLKKHDPSVRIAIIEKEYCGFGASGRNGGWAIGELAGSFAAYAKRSSAEASMRLARAMFDTVDEIGRVAGAERIDCGFAKGGNIRLARNSPQAQRQREEIAHDRSLGFTEAEKRLLTAAEARAHLNATRVQGGIFMGACAALNPAELARGLAAVNEAQGVSIFESTAVRSIDRNKIVTDRGIVTADVVVRATEAYTRDLAGQKRRLLPVYSLMIATEPLAEDVFAEIGLANRQTFSDDRFMVIYGQRTADNRLAFGGRGVPYLFGSKIAEDTEYHLASHEMIHQTLRDLLPAVGEAQITHRWGGVLGIPRDWVPGLRFDRASGHGVLGGYVGEGVAASNLAGHTMAELILEEQTERTSLPWVGVQARQWEPEPLRWLGVRTSRWVLGAADKREDQTDKEAKAAFKISRLLRGA